MTASSFSPTSPHSRLQRYARIVGAMYLVPMATALFAEGYVRGSLYVSDSATETAKNILEHNQLFRTALVADVITYCGVVVLVWALFLLLRSVNRDLILLATLLRLVELGVHFSAIIFGVVALSLLSGGEYTEAFQKPELHALVGLAIRAQAAGLNLGFILLGLGSIVTAYLFLRSGYVPRVLAVLGMYSSLALSTYAVGVIMSPTTTHYFYVAMVPMFIYEVALGLWLLLKGITIQRRPA